MKKHFWITTGLILVTVPVVSAVNFKVKNLKNSFVKFSTINISKSDFDNFEDSFQDNQNNKVKGELESVTYYAKRNDKKEELDIYLNSNTYIGEDYCFMIISVYSSDGVLEYRMDNTKVEYRGRYNHKIEIDPPLNENETSRHIKVATTFYSNSLNQHQLIEFDVDYSLNKEYVFEDNKNFKALSPVKVLATKDGEVKKYYEEFQFLNLCNISSKKPVFNVKDIRFIYNYENMIEDVPSYEECYLLIDNIYDKSDFLEENEMKKVPLELVYNDGVVNFKLKNKYYYDSGDGMIYQNNLAGRNEVNNLILPATYNANSAVYYEIHLNGFSAGNSNLIFKSYASFEYKWFGNCGTSMFCVESLDEMLEDAYYSGGVIV